FPATFGATSDVSWAVKLPVAWIVAATGRDSLFPTVIGITASCESEFALAFEFAPRFEFRPPPLDRKEQAEPLKSSNARKNAARVVGTPGMTNKRIIDSLNYRFYNTEFCVRKR